MTVPISAIGTFRAGKREQNVFGEHVLGERDNGVGEAERDPDQPAGEGDGQSFGGEDPPDVAGVGADAAQDPDLAGAFEHDHRERVDQREHADRHAHGPGCGAVDPRDHVDDRRFATARRADDGHELSGRDRQIDPAKGRILQLAVTVDLLDAGELDQRRGRHGGCRCLCQERSHCRASGRQCAPFSRSISRLISASVIGFCRYTCPQVAYFSTGLDKKVLRSRSRP